MKGVLLINLGSPDTTETKDVKRYLLIKGIILQIRPKKSGGMKDLHW